MPVEPSKLLGRVFAARFRVVALGLGAHRGSAGQPVAVVDLLDTHGTGDRGVFEISLQELQILIESGLFAEDAAGGTS